MDKFLHFYPSRCLECPEMLNEATAGDRCAACVERARNATANTDHEAEGRRLPGHRDPVERDLKGEVTPKTRILRGLKTHRTALARRRAP